MSPTKGAPQDAEARAARNTRLGRLLMGHMLSYPLAFLWAVGGVVPALYSFPKGTLETLSQDGAAWAVVRRLAVPSITIWIIVHLLSLPWALGASRRNLWIFVIGVASLASVAIVGGGGAWIWLYTR